MSYFERVQLYGIGPSGTPVPVPVDGGGHLYTFPYEQSISERMLSGYRILRKVGRCDSFAAAAANSFTDLWTGAGSANYVHPAYPGVSMTLTGASANDLGTIHPSHPSGTTTGGDATSLIDAGGNFLGATAVAQGDLAIIDAVPASNLGAAWGIITNVTATTLTIGDGWVRGYVCATGRPYRIVKASSSGTGCWALIARYLDSAYKECEAVLLCPGAADSATGITMFRVNDLRAIKCGSNDAVYGTLTLQNAGKTITYHLISAGVSGSESAVWTVPVTKLDGTAVSALYVNEWSLSGGKGGGNPPYLYGRLIASSLDGYRHTAFNAQREISVFNAAFTQVINPPLRFDPKVDVRIRVKTDTAATQATGHFSGWYE